MKELSIEEKAKAYDEALEKARKIIEYYKEHHRCDEASIEDLEGIFAELKESEDEDERMKKSIIQTLKKYSKCVEDGNDSPSAKDFLVKDIENQIAWLEKQGKETSWKPSKEEMDVLYGLAYITNQYDEYKEEVITRLYQDLKREFFNDSSYENMFLTNISTEDDVRRRSTIQVLEYAKSLDSYNQYGKADIDKNIAWLEKQNSDVDNANKEYWRGYREGKQEILDKYAELEKQGELKPWSEEDEKILKDILVDVKFEGYNNDMLANSYKKINWLKSLKDRVQPKQKLNEHDNYVINKVLDWATFVNPTSSIFEKLPKKQFIESLKNLKQRIGG